MTPCFFVFFEEEVLFLLQRMQSVYCKLCWQGSGICVLITVIKSGMVSLTKYSNFYPVLWGCRICWLNSCRRVKLPLINILGMTLNLLQSWSFGECGLPFQYHYSQVHWPGVVVPVMSPIKLIFYFDYYEYWIESLVINSNTWSHLTYIYLPPTR